MFLMAIGLVVVKPVLEHANAWWVTTMRLVAGVAFLTIHGAMPKHRAAVLAILKPGPAWRIAVPAGIIGCYLAMITWITAQLFRNDWPFFKPFAGHSAGGRRNNMKKLSHGSAGENHIGWKIMRCM